MNRRTFIRQTAALALAGAARSAWARPIGANDAIRLAVIGLNGVGAEHINTFMAEPGVRIVALCDVDPVILARETDKLKAKNVPVFATTEAREVIARDDVDVVVIATSNHWHALLMIWACQAGKDVYVEKPVSHVIWEGAQMVAAAEKYGRVVQAGTILNSDPCHLQAADYIKSGKLGRVLWIHGFNYKLRPSIGLRRPWYPSHLDYDRYCGPAPVRPLARNQLHYDWHWSWDTGNGELGNMGAHLMGLTLLFGDKAMPRSVTSIGGRYVVEDAAETPNCQLVLYDFPSIPMVCELRGLPARPGVKYMDERHGLRTGIAVHCEHGYYAGWLGGAIRDNDGREIVRFVGDGGAGHFSNFLAAVRSRRTDRLAAPITHGHRAATFCHLGNISHRIGRRTDPDEIKAAVERSPNAPAIWDRLVQHLTVHGVSLRPDSMTLGGEVVPGTALEEIAEVRGPCAPRLETARDLIRGTPRPPYCIPETV